MHRLPGLATLARRHGLLTSFRGSDGTQVTASNEALQAVLGALGVEASSPAAVRRELSRGQESGGGPRLSPVIVAWEGQSTTVRVCGLADREQLECRLLLENGSETDWMASAVLRSSDGTASEALIRLQPVELGYHRLQVRAGAQELCATVISAPARAHGREGERAWGIFAPVYALRSGENAGAGDLGDLDTLAEMVSSLGGGFVATLPILASFLDEPFDPSPYAPVSRRFWSEYFARVPGTPDRLTRPLRALPLVDHKAVMKVKKEAIRAAADAAWDTASWAPVAEMVRSRPDIESYARFRAALAKVGPWWRSWPRPLRAGPIPHGSFDEGEHRYQLYAQWLIEDQLAAVSRDAGDRGVKLYLDFPLGVHRDGFDTWADQALFADRVSVGAPPDTFQREGQDWGFPPMRPSELRRTAYKPLIKALRHHMRIAGMLRLDHVMGLHRLYWVPGGLGPKDGVYVRYPHEELYAVICLEARRHGVTVVGEDLGTVPAAVRAMMRRRGLRRMFVVQLELDPDRERPLRRPPEDSVASLNTHDLPPFAGFLRAKPEEAVGSDASSRVEALERAIGGSTAGRVRSGAAVQEPPLLARSAYEWLARTPAEAVLVNIEDLWGETRSQNVPGTAREHPNWRRKLDCEMDELPTLPAFNSLAGLSALRASGRPARGGGDAS